MRLSGAKHLGWLVVVPMLFAAQGKAAADERTNIEAACVKLGLGDKPCACIAEDTMKKFEPRMREVIYLSLKDEVGFEIMIKSGQVTQEEVTGLNAYQEYIEPICRVVE